MRNKIRVDRYPEPQPYLKGLIITTAFGVVYWPSGNNTFLFSKEDVDELEKLVEVYETLAAVDEFLSEDADSTHPPLK